MLLPKNALLLIQDITYGQLRIPQVVRDDVSVNLDRWGDHTVWRDGGIPYLAMPAAMAAGAMTDNSPIDMVSWSSTGIAPVNALAPWQQCVGLLVRW